MRKIQYTCTKANGYVEVPLRGGDGSHAALVDAEDFDRLNIGAYTWRIVRTQPGAKNVYAYAKMLLGGRRRTVYLHRFVMDLAHGDPRQVDHRDGDGLDNRRQNLRIATPRQNTVSSRPRLRPKHPELPRGVNMVWRSFGAYLSGVYLGCYPTPEEAAYAYNCAAGCAYGEFARLNAIPRDRMPTPERQDEIAEQAGEKIAPYMRLYDLF